MNREKFRVLLVIIGAALEKFLFHHEWVGAACFVFVLLISILLLTDANVGALKVPDEE